VFVYLPLPPIHFCRKKKEMEAAAKKAKAKKPETEPTEEDEESDAHKIETHISSSEEEGA